MKSTDILPEKRFFRVDEVAEHFGVAERTVYNWIDSGRLEFFRIGGKCIRIKRESILEIISVGE